MDKILGLLRGLNGGEDDDDDRQSTDRSRHRSSDRGNSRHSHQDEEVEAVIAMLASGLMTYALRQYAKSSHNDKRRKKGGADIDFVMLEQIGQKILRKVIEATSGHLKTLQANRSLKAEEEKGRTKRRQEPERERGHHRRHRNEHHSESEGERHRDHRRRRRRREGEEREEKPKSRRDATPKITITPPSVSSDSSLSESPDPWRGRRRQRRRSPVRHGHEKLPSSTAHHRPSHDEKDRKHSTTTPDLGSLRVAVANLSTLLIELSARSSGSKEGHDAECEFYDKFVEKSGPVQDAVGDVLGQIRELEAAEDQARRHRHRRRGG